VKGVQILHPPECILPLKLKICFDCCQLDNFSFTLNCASFAALNCLHVRLKHPNWQLCYNFKIIGSLATIQNLAALLQFKKIGCFATISKKLAALLQFKKLAALLQFKKIGSFATISKKLAALLQFEKIGSLATI